MRIDYTEQQQKLRQQLRQYFSELIPPADKQAMLGKEGCDLYKYYIQKIGAAGWLALGWPKKYGGQGATMQEQLIFFEEALFAGAPIPFVTLNTVGPALMEHGSEELKAQFLPGIAAGEIHFAIGYTESDAGTDLANLSTAAIKEGNDFIINGSKIFTSGADHADFIWLATRTSTEGKKHHGISIFIVDTRLPGFSCTPLHTVNGRATTMSFYENIRIPQSMLVGELNGGWRLITSQLNHERIGLAAMGMSAWDLFRQTLAWARETKANGKRVIDDPNAAHILGEVYSRLEAMRMMNTRMAWEQDQGNINPAFASGLKVFSSECAIEVCRLLMEVVGPASIICSDSPAAVLQGHLEREFRGCQINTFGGGVNEVQRGIIANFGLGMPRHR